MSVNSLPKTVTRQHRGSNLILGLSAPESSTLTTRLPSHPLLLHPFNGLSSRTTCVSRYQKGKTSLDLNEARDDGVWDAVASAGLYANYLHLAPDS